MNQKMATWKLRQERREERELFSVEVGKATASEQQESRDAQCGYRGRGKADRKSSLGKTGVSVSPEVMGSRILGKKGFDFCLGFLAESFQAHGISRVGGIFIICDMPCLC